MVIFVYGTTGESIKIAPVAVEIPAEKRMLIDTSQQPKLLELFYKATNFPQPDITLSRGWKGEDLTKPQHMIAWSLIVWSHLLFGGTMRKIRKTKRREKTIVIVHGDTVTTVYGTLLGRLMGLKVAHIEAGLRSGNWKHPFPEEIDRRIVSKLARIHYSPGDVPTEALTREHVRGDIVNTGANTVADSAHWAQQQTPQDLPKLPKSFTLVSIHRNELLVSPKQVRELLKELLAHAEAGNQVVFLDHPITQNRMSTLGLDDILDHKNILRVPKQNYVNMMHLIKQANVLVTDSGGLQEESFYLGIPCIVYREATERTEGLGSNVALSGINPEKLRELLVNYKTELVPEKPMKLTPTDIIINDLKAKGYI